MNIISRYWVPRWVVDRSWQILCDYKNPDWKDVSDFYPIEKLDNLFRRQP